MNRVGLAAGNHCQVAGSIENAAAGGVDPKNGQLRMHPLNGGVDGVIGGHGSALRLLLLIGEMRAVAMIIIAADGAAVAIASAVERVLEKRLIDGQGHQNRCRPTADAVRGQGRLIHVGIQYPQIPPRVLEGHPAGEFPFIADP